MIYLEPVTGAFCSFDYQYLSPYWGFLTRGGLISLCVKLLENIMYDSQATYGSALMLSKFVLHP
ncbi:MAG: hypothetical protein ACTS73_03180 [Arsenophonus sp. NEOnobi-MAG3]